MTATQKLSEIIPFNFEKGDEKRWAKFLKEHLEYCETKTNGLDNTAYQNFLTFVNKNFAEKEVLKTIVRLQFYFWAKKAEFESPQRNKARSDRFYRSIINNEKYQIWAVKANVIYLEQKGLLPN